MGKKKSKGTAPAKQGGSMASVAGFIGLVAVAAYFVLAQVKPELLSQLMAQNDSVNISQKVIPTLDPSHYISRAKKDSKRIGGEKKDAIVTLGDPNGRNMTLEELNVPFVDYLHASPPVLAERAMGAKFRNFKQYRLSMYWDDGSPQGVYSGAVDAMDRSSTNTYTTHTFIFRDERGPEPREVARFTMRDDMHLMIIEPDEGEEWVYSSQQYLDAKEEQRFMKQYFQEHGTPWLSHYPRPKPRLPFWPADYVGQRHSVKSFQGFFNCDPGTAGVDSDCYDPTPIDLSLLVVSVSPRVLVIENLMSEWECLHIKTLGEAVIKRSSVGTGSNGFKSNTRTSENGWLNRHQDQVLDTIFRRYADALGVRDEDLEHDVSAENLQVVRYLQNQLYAPHHDFGDTGVDQRFLTLLLYLEVPEQGGHTSFPKAFDGRGLKVTAPKGGAALFYSMLPDGNSDDKSLHSGTEVLKGTKWVCNLWVWDAKVK